MVIKVPPLFFTAWFPYHILIFPSFLDLPFCHNFTTISPGSLLPVLLHLYLNSAFHIPFPGQSQLYMMLLIDINHRYDYFSSSTARDKLSRGEVEGKAAVKGDLGTLIAQASLPRAHHHVKGAGWGRCRTAWSSYQQSSSWWWDSSKIKLGSQNQTRDQDSLVISKQVNHNKYTVKLCRVHRSRSTRSTGNTASCDRAACRPTYIVNGSGADGPKLNWNGLLGPWQCKWRS